VFIADQNNGSYVQRIRFKALGTNIATVARVYIGGTAVQNSVSYDHHNSIIPTPGAPAGAAGTTGGTLATQNLFCIVVAQDQYGNWTANSTESSNVAVTGPTGNVTWTWNSSAGAVAYRCYVGPISGGESNWFQNTAAQTCVQTVAFVAGQQGDWRSLTASPFFYGEVSLPATTIASQSATAEVDYPLNFALPPGGRILVGLGNTVAAGWATTVLGGSY